MNEPTLPVQRRLLDAAITLFATRGYHATRVADIVQQAGVAQGTFYLYFANKERIFAFLIDDFFERLLTKTLTAYHVREARSGADILELVRQIWRAVLQSCLEERDLVIMLQRDAGALGPTMMTHVQAQYQILVEQLAEQIRLGSARGLVRDCDPLLAAWAIFGMGERAIFYALQLQPSPTAQQLDTLAEDLVHLELEGLLINVSSG